MHELRHVIKASESAMGPHGAQRGFNLVEVMVALLVLAVGLLGLAALQNMGLRVNHESYERTQATLLIYEMIDRMRANPAAVLAGNYDLPLTKTPPPAGTDCGISPCITPQDMASYDMNQWISTVAGVATPFNPGITRPTLAGGEGAIVTLGNSLYDISVEWKQQDVTMNQTVRVHLP